MSRVDVRSTRSETLVGTVILLALGVIATWVFLRQFRYDPAVFIPDAPAQGKAPSAAPGGNGASPFLPYLPEGMAPLSTVEVFGPETLSEKINGKAELYLSAGFVKLTCQRFAKTGETDSWVEVFLYDMEGQRNAFSVFSSQRRADGVDTDFARFAYHSRNALFLVHGHQYIEMVASNEGMLEEMLAFGRAFVEKTAEGGGSGVNELALFPREGLEEESVALLSSDVFGYEGLNNVFIAHYNLDGKRLTLFLSARRDGEEADSLASAYRTFLLENGGQPLEVSTNIPGLKVVEILGSYEYFFTHHHFLAGVHEADDADLAGRLAERLHQALRGAAK